MAFTTFAGGVDADATERDTASAAGSQDRAWTTTGDAGGFHVLAADAKDQYGWRTAASLSEPGFDTDTWIGNACVTGSGKRAVVVYAPRAFTNKPQLMARGGFTAIVDLASGEVTKLDLQASLSYYNPGCGVDESAILTQSPGEDKTSTRLVRVDAATGSLAPAVETRGQVTSAVPARDGSVVAADGGTLVKIEANGTSTALAATRGVPYRLTADKDGGVVVLDKLPDLTARAKNATPALARAAAERITATQIRKPKPKKTKPTELATGPLTETGLARDAAGTVYVTGPVKQTPGKLPDTTKLLPTAPKDTKVSTRGETLLTHTAWADGKDTRITPGKAVDTRPVSIDLTVRATGRTASAVVDPAAKPSPHISQGKDRSPKLPAPKRAQAAAPSGAQALTDPRPQGSPTQIVEAERTCAVPRNDPRNQAMQPKPRQVEWAVDQAIVGNLDNKVSRPENWKNLGMPAYQPQAMFPLQALSGGGSRVPAQVMLGVTAQESNMWQASRTAVPGVTGNPLIGNYYGINYYDGNPGNDWDIDWSKADCGYGITQVTDHMRLAGREEGKLPAWDYQQQRAVALDYTANIAAGLQILTEKWNVTHDNGLIVNNGNSAKIENWYFALWAYNSGFYPNPGDGSPWGVGWANNPANPEWDAGRLPFLEKADGSDSYPDAAHPQDWPYQEKVIGWAGHPLEGLESPGKMVSGYRQAWWNGRDGDANTAGSAKYYRAQAKPPEGLFCAPENACDATKITDSASNDPGVGPCTRADHKCWWNKPVTYKPDCDYSCGNDIVRFNTTYPEEADGTAYPPNCGLAGLPAAGGQIVDDVPAGVPSIRPGCNRPETAGTFSLRFGNDDNATAFPAKVDTHQLGGGFGGHFYFAHTWPDTPKGQMLKVTATWRLERPLLSGQAEVFAHIPDHGAQAKNATYEITAADGPVYVTIDQTKGTGNRWVSLGAFEFGDVVPQVRLSNIAADGTGDKDVAFDAVTFVSGVYFSMPDVSLPDPDENSPDLDYDDVGDLPQNIPSLPGGLARNAGGECAPVPAKSGLTMCAKITDLSPEEISRSSRAQGAARANATTGPVPWCDSSSLARQFKRFESCLKQRLTVEYKRNGTTEAVSYWTVHQEVKLYVNQWYIDEEITLTPEAPGAFTTTDIALETLCAVACTVGTPTTQGFISWAPGDFHSATTRYRHTWTGQPTPNSQDTIDMGWLLKPTAPGYPAATSTGWNNITWEARCDNKIPARRAGCVFINFVPELDLNSKKFPVPAQMYWMAEKKLGNHPGSREYKSPLHREGVEKEMDANRNNVCPTSGPNAYVKHPLATVGSKGKVDCDEYPFASSLEGGGGNPRPSTFAGDKCVQFYAVRSGRWTLKHDNRNSPLPTTNADGTWNSICARGSIPDNQNQGIASPLGWHLFKTARVMQDDKFYIGTPGFEHCSMTLPCTVDFRP
ncbi:hypothetical protein [Streptomyces melanogenes]|uniref:golvesin C-terminal-like domain-containing protein n=1 Tax=Streptomyces melanogenes TaxID=67326 RepID=UPI00379DF70D